MDDLDHINALDDLDHINALIDARGWEDLYVVNLLLEFVAKRKLRADLLAFLRQAARDEDDAKTRAM